MAARSKHTILQDYKRKDSPYSNKNVDGKYIVDLSCIDCGICASIAPSNFTRNTDEGIYYVKKQPSNPEEEKQCKKAAVMCPVDAISPKR